MPPSRRLRGNSTFDPLTKECPNQFEVPSPSITATIVPQVCCRGECSQGKGQAKQSRSVGSAAK